VQIHFFYYTFICSHAFLANIYLCTHMLMFYAAQKAGSSHLHVYICTYTRTNLSMNMWIYSYVVAESVNNMSAKKSFLDLRVETLVLLALFMFITDKFNIEHTHRYMYLHTFIWICMCGNIPHPRFMACISCSLTFFFVFQFSCFPLNQMFITHIKN